MNDPISVERVPIVSLHKDEKNARSHQKKNLDAIKASLAEFGQQKPIVVDADGLVIAGNGTLDAALALGWTEIDVTRTSLRGTRARAFAIADNRTAELAAWDDAILAEALATIQADEDLESICTGFDEKEIERAITRGTGAGETHEDEVPEPPAEPVTKPGDLWILGDHRLLCGDSTKAEDVERVMSGKKAETLVTSPPYWSEQAYDKKTSIDGVRSFMDAFVSVWSGFVTRRIQIQTGHTSEQRLGCGKTCAKILLDSEWTNALAKVGWKLRHRRCWSKEHFGGSQAGPETDYVDEGWEVIMIFWNPEFKHTGQESIPDVSWTMAGVWSDIGGHRKEGEVNDHPCPFPVELAGRMIQIYSGKGALVCEPFMGSGTTLIAAEQLGRHCFGIEIEPRYCDVTVNRWKNLTGKEARLA